MRNEIIKTWKIKTTSKVLINYYTIKKYNDDYYKLTYLKYPKINNEGIEKEFKCFKIKEVDRDVNDEKLDCNISRARSKIFEYSLCNEFDYFITLTLDKKKYNRYDLKKYIKDLGQFIRDERKRLNLNIEYLLIPELHLDGAWHMHGLIKGIPDNEFRLLGLEEKLPYKLLSMIKNGRKMKSWVRYSSKFGFSTIEKVNSNIKVSKYITKYVSKSLQTDLRHSKESKLYYVTRGLKTAETVLKGTLKFPLFSYIDFDFENEYIILKDLNGEEFDNLFAVLSD